MAEGEDIELPLDPKSLERVSEHSLKGGLSNLVLLDEFGEGAVIHQLRERYNRDEIYTNIGTILVSVNPYKQLPIYSSAQVDKYRKAAEQGAVTLATLEPHAYAVAAEAYTKLYEDEGDSPSSALVKHNQAVIISGESGAGKTEATKTVLQYLSEVAGSVSGVEQQILQTNPILEAFGNARTLRNNNSSRFGKWMEIHFQPAAGGKAVKGAMAPGRKIVAARIVSYLLEKSRVTTQTKGERSYHVFYQMCAGLPTDLRQKFGLLQASEYFFLNQSDTYSIQGVDDHEEFNHTAQAFALLNFPAKTVEAIWQLLAAILQLGNLKTGTHASKNDVTVIANRAELEQCTRTLGLPSADVLASALCYRSVTIRGSMSMIPLNSQEVEANRDALAKTLYAKLFDYLVARMNAVLFKDGASGNISDAAKRAGRTIGILDIFGFEIFDSNLFEQFCINYANEKLQQHFNTYIFKLEQEEYSAEGIDVASISFVDNVDCLLLIEARPGPGVPYAGVLAMLDEEVMIPKGSDEALVQKMHTKFAPAKGGGQPHKHYDIVKKNPEIFVIKHYAGPVEYNSQGLLAKNKNKLNDNLEQLMAANNSSLKLIAEIFGGSGAAEPVAPEASSRGRAGPAAAMNSPSNASKKKEATLGFQFYGQLNELMQTLHACTPQYIRCLKPNAVKQPNVFDTRMVLKQMSYAGLFEAIRIRASGFPNRKALSDFGRRYKVCLSKAQIVEYARSSARDPREGVGFLLKALSPPLASGSFQLGRTKVFLKTSARNQLDALRDQNLTKWVIQLQAWSRMVVARRLRRDLGAFKKRIEKELKGDCSEASLSALLAEAQERHFDRWLFSLQLVVQAHAALADVARLVNVLKAALKQPGDGELDVLEGALEQVQRLKRTHASFLPAELSTSQNKSVKALGEQVALASKRRDHLLEEQRVLLAVNQAVLGESLPELEAAMSAATKFGVDAKSHAMVKANTLLQQLRAEEKLMETLRKATKARVPTDLEQAIVAVQQGKVALDGPRNRDFAEACATLHELHAGVVREAIAKNDEQRLQTVLLPKLQQLALADLVEEVQAYLAEAARKRAAAEAARVREAARQEEEKRLAVERANLDASERARLAEQDRLRREEEDRQIAEAEAEAAAAATSVQIPTSSRQRGVAAVGRDGPAAPTASASGTPARAPPARGMPPRLPPPLIPGPPADDDMPPPPPGDDDDAPPPPPDDDSMPPPPPPDDDSMPPPPAPSDDFMPPPPAPPAPVEDFDLPPPPSIADAAMAARNAAISMAAPTLAEHPVDQELDAAILKRNVAMLDKALASAAALKHNSRLVRVAQNMRTKLTEEARINKALEAAVNSVDVAACKSLIKEAKELGITASPLLEEARSLCYGLSDNDVLLQRIKKAIPLGNEDALRKLLAEAAELKVEADCIEQARDWLASRMLQASSRASTVAGSLEQYRDLTWNDTMRINRGKPVDSMLYHQFVASRGSFPLHESVFPALRREGNFAKGNLHSGLTNYLNKGGLKAGRLVYQTDAMPRSLVKLNTEYCGGKAQSKAIKGAAAATFADIRGYMKTVYHNYPATLAYNVVQTGLAQPLLRDEIFCQLIKQTSGNPSADSTLLGLKLLYLCASTFPPSNPLRPCLLSHLAQYAHAALPDNTALGFTQVDDVASACYTALEHVAIMTAQGIPIKPPTMDDIETMTSHPVTRSGLLSFGAGGSRATSSSSAINADLPPPP